MQPADFLLLAAPSNSLSWFLVLFFVILGVLVTLSPTKRTSEIKKPQDH